MRVDYACSGEVIEQFNWPNCHGAYENSAPYGGPPMVNFAISWWRDDGNNNHRHNLLQTTKALWLDYKPIQFKTKMLKNFDEFLEDAFKSMQYSTLHTGIQDQLEYCLLLADKDPKVEQSCLQTIFNSDFFWE